MKIDKKLQFLIPFLNKDIAKLVNLKKLKKIMAYSVPLGKDSETKGALNRYPDYTYNITLRISRNDDIKKKQSPEYIYTILETLGHELAHLKYWEHTPEHYILTNKIGLIFGKVLKQQGVKDTYTRLNRLKI